MKCGICNGQLSLQQQKVSIHNKLTLWPARHTNRKECIRNMCTTNQSIAYHFYYDICSTVHEVAYIYHHLVKYTFLHPGALRLLWVKHNLPILSNFLLAFFSHLLNIFFLVSFTDPEVPGSIPGATRFSEK
jgi:hypothetical protein